MTIRTWHAQLGVLIIFVSLLLTLFVSMAPKAEARWCPPGFISATYYDRVWVEVKVRWVPARGIFPGHWITRNELRSVRKTTCVWKG